MAMIVSSMNRWVTKKDISNGNTYGIGKIVQLDWGINYSPELSYKHPAVIVEEWKNSMLVVPTTSTAGKVSEAYHPIDNPEGKWYYRKVGVNEGFLHECALVLDNAKIMAKSRIISVSGNITGNINEEENVFREIRRTMIQHFFSKEWIQYQKLVQKYEKLDKQNAELQEKYNYLLQENTQLKSANNNGVS